MYKLFTKTASLYLLAGTLTISLIACKEKAEKNEEAIPAPPSPVMAVPDTVRAAPINNDRSDSAVSPALPVKSAKKSSTPFTDESSDSRPVKTPD